MELRKLFRLRAAVGALVFTVYQAMVARRDHRDWEGAVKKIGDPSAASLYRLNFEIDCVEILVAWGFAGGLIYVLRPKPTRKP